jgi:2-polyprenyl-3-methyl-5-hydroxy-6-metoxy-1,4-benzoquinol methylase
MSNDTLPREPKIASSTPFEGHCYVRRFDPHGDDSLAKIARLIRPNTRVLDLGTGPGILGKYLSTALDCIVDGVELSAEHIQVAAPFYQNLQLADLEQVNLTALFSECYDYIVCADVLEHLRNPEAVVSQFPALLKSSGRILLSIPNIAYAGVIAGLLAGEFRYRPEGLLDITHLRFFTRKSLLEFLAAHNLTALSIDTVSYDLRDSEFRDYYLDTLPPLIYRLLKAYPDSLTYQFIVEAIPGKPVRDIKPNKTTNELHFSCQVYWRLGRGEYKEKNSTQALGCIGNESQVISLSLPPMEQAPSGIRVDLADRPGFLRLYRICLYDKEKNCIWKWKGNIICLQTKEAHQVEFASALTTPFGVNVLLTGEDPYIELPLNEGNLKPLKEGGNLELELSWPISADFVALAQRLGQRDSELIKQRKLIELQSQQAHERDKLLELKDRQRQEKEQLLEQITCQLNEKEQLLEKNNLEILKLNRVAGEQRNEINACENQLSQCYELIKSLEAQLAYRDSWRGWGRRPFRPLKRWCLKIIEIIGQ